MRSFNAARAPLNAGAKRQRASKNSTSKWGFIQKEIRLAIEAFKRVPPGDVFLIPCRLEPCEPRYPELRELHWIDLFPSFETGFQQLLRALDVDLGEPEQLQRSPRSTIDVHEYRLLFDRPAFSMPCIFESAVPRLERALDDISAALSTGTYHSRSGNLLRNIVPISMIEDEKLRETFDDSQGQNHLPPKRCPFSR
jgi:TIR domain-containing protein